MSKKKKGKKGRKEAFDPEKDTGILRPVDMTIAAGEINDRYSDYPSRGLNPVKLASILRDADEGNVRSQMELFEEMEEKDAHLFSQMQTRKLAVTGLDWEVQPFSPDDEQDKAIAEWIKDQLLGIENLDDILTDLLDAIGKGVSIMEIIWGVDSDGFNVIEDIRYVHQKKLVWDWETDDMLVCTEQFPNGIHLPKNKFVVHRYKAKSGHPSRAGIMRIVSWMYLFKNYTVKDWVSFCEVYGMPLRIGKYDPGASEADKQELLDAIVRIGSDAAGIIPETTMIEFKEANKTTSADIYEQLARYCDEQISKAILGQTLTSDSGGGSYAQSKTHNEVRHDLTAADAKALAVTIRRDIIRPLVEYNFGADANVPFIRFNSDEEEDQKEAVDMYRTLVCDMGLKVPASHVYKRFSIPEPEEGEETLQPNMVARTHLLDGSQDDGVDPEQLKDDSEALTPEQIQLDDMTDLSNQLAARLMEQMVKPLETLVEHFDGDLGDLQEFLKDEEKLKALYEDMESPELEDLLHQTIYLSSVIGRTQE